MKKNFFKKLSFVLALAMIVSVLAPAAGAFAAAKPKLNSTKKYLFLGQTNKYDFNIVTTSKRTGWKYKWTSSNKAVATVASNGLTTGKSIGTAEISVVIKNKDGEEIADLSADVIVKDSIKTVKITNLPKDGKMLAGATNDFNRSFTTYGGSTKKTTSVTKWTVDSDKATISTQGVFKATEAGEYTVTARSFQSNDKYNAWLKDASAVKVVPTDSYKVTVVASIDSVKQVDLNTVEVKFTSPMTDVAANLTVSSLVAATSTKVKQTVKAVTMSEDKLTATVDMYADFAANTTYVVDFTGMEAKQFVGATSNFADVDSIQIATATAKVGTTPTEIIVKLLNKDGVNIANNTLLGRVTLKSSSEKVFLDTSSIPNKITFFTIGDVTTIEATYHTYNYDTTSGDEIGAKTATGTITGVAEASNPLSSIAAWTFASSVPSKFDTVNQIIAAEDGLTNLYVNAVKADGKNYINSGAAATGTEFRFSSSDSSVLIVYADGKVYPVKAGSANVIVEYCADTTASTKVYTVIGAIGVNVRAKRVATTLTLTPSNFALSNSLTLNDHKDVKVEVADQYGVKMPTAEVSVAKIVNSGAGTPIVNGTQGVVETITFNGVVGGSAVVAGDYTYSVTSRGLTRYVTFKVSAPASGSTAPVASTSYKLSVDTTVDAKVSSTVTGVALNVKVVGYANNGIALEALDTADLATANLSLSIVKPDGTTANTLLNTSGTYAAVVDVAKIVTGAYQKLATGNYTIKLYKTVSGATTLIDAATVTVKDTQVAPTVVVKQVESSGKTTLLAAIQQCFVVTDSANEDVSDEIYVGSVIGNASALTGESVFVKTIKWDETVGGATLTHELTVNTLVTIK
jgi:hypothetical protein